MMMGVEAPETCWKTHKRQVINLWNCWFWLVNLFELYDDARTCQRQTETGVQFCFFLLLAIDGGVVSFTFRPSYSRRYLDKTLYGSQARYACNQSVYRPNIPGPSKNLFPLDSFTFALSMASSHCNLLSPEVAPVCCCRMQYWTLEMAGLHNCFIFQFIHSLSFCYC
jgi:hypothetical protein